MQGSVKKNFEDEVQFCPKMQTSAQDWTGAK
jgi:hypothetical protein